MSSLLLFWSIVSLAMQALAIPTIYISGSKFFLQDAAKTQFFIKGVVYQPGGSSRMVDPLANKAQCDEDIVFMKDLGVNTISVYTVNATVSHDGCMDAFAAAGIYVLLGLAGPTYAVNRAKPVWTLDMYEKYSAVIDAFAKYDNVLGFYSGTETLNSMDALDAAPVMKAVIADLKNYIFSRRHRQIPIGYGAADVAVLRDSFTDYLACGGSNATVDFVSFNNYAWCGDYSFRTSGFETILKEQDSHLLPVFFGETGCNTVQRTFSDQAVILGPQMNGRFSGAVIYEWTNEENKYGLVAYSQGRSSSVSVPAPLGSEFTSLKRQWATLIPNGKETSWSASVDLRTVMACPSSTSGTSAWTIKPTATLPVLGVRVFAGRAAVATSTKSTNPLLGVSETGSALGSALFSTLPSSTSASSSNNVPDDTQPGNTTGNRSGSRIGIIVGVVIAAMVLLGFLIWFLVRRKRQTSPIEKPLEPEAGLEVSGVDTFQPKPELDAFSAGVVGIRHREQKEKGVVELAGKEKVDVVELGGQETVIGQQDVSILPVIELPNTGSAPIEASSGSVIGRKAVAKPSSRSSQTQVNSSNTPWMDEGRAEFFQTSTQPHISESPPAHLGSPSATKSLAQAQAQTSDRAEIERLEEEERRLDREIVESERLAKLKFERLRVRQLLEEKRGLGASGLGSSGASSGRGGGAGGMGGGGG